MTFFTEKQLSALAAPLNRANVKTRDQSGRKLSYIEGWRAIDEANRIFGFDGWTRETIDINCVSEKPREIGAGKVPGFGVSYTAKVRINVNNIIREGIGAGHGIDRDLGQAHESAIKEAETDAMKRALMTFGNPFGLALYDKEQANVQDEPRLAKKDAGSLYKELQAELRGKKTEEDLKGWVGQTTVKARISQLPEDWQQTLRDDYQESLIIAREAV